MATGWNIRNKSVYTLIIQSQVTKLMCIKQYLIDIYKYIYILFVRKKESILRRNVKQESGYNNEEQ